MDVIDAGNLRSLEYKKLRKSYEKITKLARKHSLNFSTHRRGLTIPDMRRYYEPLVSPSSFGGVLPQTARQ